MLNVLRIVSRTSNGLLRQSVRLNVLGNVSRTSNGLLRQIIRPTSLQRQPSRTLLDHQNQRPFHHNTKPLAQKPNLQIRTCSTSSNNDKDYKTLGLDPNASALEIKKAHYNMLINYRTYINQAYDNLMNPNQNVMNFIGVLVLLDNILDNSEKNKVLRSYYHLLPNIDCDQLCQILSKFKWVYCEYGQCGPI